MRDLKAALLGLLLLPATPLQAGQPISVSMAECAGISFAFEHLVHTPERKDFILQVGKTWAKAADAEAGRDMSAVVDEKAALWRAKGKMTVFTQEYKDWTQYCGSLARHREIKFPARP